MNKLNIPKPTSFEYGEKYQLEQVGKHRQRHTNHWRGRLEIFHGLMEQHVLPGLHGRPKGEIVAVDVGCSIGTMSIECAALGFRTIGIDFDPAALQIAKELCAEEKAEVKFVCGDIADWKDEWAEKFDIAICFDIFEHLHDDEVGSLLKAIRTRLNVGGKLVFWTFPTQYDYIFFGRGLTRVPLLLFAPLPTRLFTRLARAYASLLDVALVLGTGKTYRERIKKFSHCNPTTPERMRDIMERAGYVIEVMETRQVYPFLAGVQRWFSRHRIADRNLFGVARSKTFP